MSVKRRRTFWIANSKTPLHEQRVLKLSEHGFEFTFFKDASEALTVARESRPICIIIDSPTDINPAAAAALQTLVKDPELNGVRFIASIYGERTDLIKTALAENFRDVVPMKLPDDNWVHRILYASGATTELGDTAPHEVGMNQISSVITSGRVVWVNQTHMRIECRGSQRIGSSLNISGPMAKAFNLPNIRLNVSRIEKSKLMFRYSQALTCSWQAPASHMEHVKSTLRHLLVNKPDPKIRAFLAIGRPNIRATLAKGLNPEIFYVRAALQKANLHQEVGYFSPQIIFFDDKLLESLSATELKEILNNLPVAVPIVIFGAESEALKGALVGRRKFIEPSIQQAHLSNAKLRYGITPSSDFDDEFSDICPIAPEHPWSKIGVQTPARLISLSPTGGHVLLPYSVGNFSLATLESQLIGKILARDPIIKITSSHASEAVETFTQNASFTLSDVDSTERLKLGQTLIDLVKEYYLPYQDVDIPNFISAEIKEAPRGHIDMLLDTQGSIDAAQSGGGFNGSAAFKSETLPSAPPTEKAPLDKKPPVNTKSSKPAVILRTARKKSRTTIKMDSTVVKAMALLALFGIILVLALQYAEKTGKQRGSELGREYSDFFFRMNPELRKKTDRNEQTP